MCVAVISGQECLVDEVQQSARKAGLGLWFLEQRFDAWDSQVEVVDAVAILTGAASHEDRSTRGNPAERGCTPFNCASCEGAALCGGHAIIN